MFKLETLGGLALLDGAGAEVGAQRRRLALLALLAASGGRGLSRDQLMALLWPEIGAGSSRHRLEQLLYVVRQRVAEDLFEGSDPLRLNPRVLASDIESFEGALHRGADAEAVTLYRGPFLDGFYLNEAEELERWVETKRTIIRDANGAALERLAARAAREGDPQGAVGWWRKRVALDTPSARSVLALLQALASAGERAGALQVAAGYQALLRQQLDIDPEPELLAFVDHLRGAPRPGGPGDGDPSGRSAARSRATGGRRRPQGGAGPRGARGGVGPGIAADGNG